MRVPGLDHLMTMTDDVGLFQHARGDVPSRKHGYCTDDIARALIVACRAAGHPGTRDGAERLLPVYLAFVADAALPDGWFHNFMGYDRRWQDARGTPDSLGRAIWGLGYAAVHAPRAGWRRLAGELLATAMPHVDALAHLRSRAYAALGAAEVVAADAGAEPYRAALAAAVEPIAAAYRATAGPDWAWCEETLTYDNARLCEALIRAGGLLRRPDLVEIGCAMLDFYAAVTIEGDTFVPIGNDGWYRRGGPRARFGQQPLEAAALIDAGAAALAATGNARYRLLLDAGYAWFGGRNALGAALTANGGCCDGLDRDGVNRNMGAESTLAYLMSAFAIAAHGSLRPLHAATSSAAS